MDFEVMKAYLPRFWDALLLTLRIGWQGVALALALGVACAVAVHWKIPVLRQIVGGYIELFRNTPLLNRFGQRITTRGIASQLKHFAEKYGMNKEVVYPHSFRHRFAKNFLDRFNDLALLADLMGHESIETTRIYLRRTASEQQKIVDKVVNW